MDSNLTPRLRLMTPEDFNACQVLWRRCAGVILRDWESPQTLSTMLVRNPGGGWVIESGDQLIGTILAGHDGWRGYIYHAAIDPDWRRSGLGSTLAHQALTYFASQHIHRIHMLVDADNQAGKSFWRAMGAKVRADVTLLTWRATGVDLPPLQ